MDLRQFAKLAVSKSKRDKWRDEVEAALDANPRALTEAPPGTTMVYDRKTKSFNYEPTALSEYYKTKKGRKEYLENKKRWEAEGTNVYPWPPKKSKKE